MATNLIYNFIGVNKFSKTTTAINRDLKTMGRNVDKVGKSLRSAFALAGVGLSVSSLTNFLKDSSKAAALDAKSQQQLALALKNSLGATKQAISGAEDFIQKLSNQVGIVDDELRPALATAVRATGSLAKGQKLLSIALDVSAGTGKDLGTVTNAMAKANNGNLGALKKLLPSIKAGTDWMGQLKTQFNGAALAAAQTDPYQRLSVIMDNLKETVGYALLPYMQELADYLASPKGQVELQKLVDGFVKLAKTLGQIITFLSHNIQLIINLAKLSFEIRVAWMLNVGAMKLFTLWTNRAKGSMVGLGLAIKRTGIGLLVVGLGEVAMGFQDAQSKGESFTNFISGSFTNFFTGIADFRAFILGKPSVNERNLRAAKADQDRWIKLGQRFGKDIVTKVGGAVGTATQKLKSIGADFTQSIGVATGLFGQDENSVFNVDFLINKAKRMVDASKGFADNLRKLRKAGAGQDVQNELIAMGPAAGNIAAKGLLSSGKLSEYLGLRGSLMATGNAVSAVANNTGQASYTINLNKSNVSAQDIINAITAYEKKTGRKYFAR